MKQKNHKRKEFRDENGRVLSQKEIIKRRQLLQRKAQLEKATEQTKENFSSLKGKKYIGEAGGSAYGFKMQTSVSTLADGSLFINSTDALVELPEAIKRKVDPNLLMVFTDNILKTMNAIIGQATLDRKAAMEPLSAIIGELQDVQEAEMEYEQELSA